MDKLLYGIGSAVCHQLNDRTIIIGGKLLPVCARCTGIYISITVSVLYLIMRRRWQGNKLPGISVTLIMAFSFLPFMVDGVGSYAHFWQTNNLIRIITGLFGGYSVPIFFILIQNFNINKDNNKIIVKDYKEAIVLILLCLFLCIMVYSGLFGSWYIIGIIICFGILFLYTNVIGMLLKLILVKASGEMVYSISFIIVLILIFIRNTVFYSI